MQIIIHRGIDQIGGCITEIQSTSGTKILIDLGHNLPETDGPVNDIYDTPENLDRLLEGVSAVFYTHYHGDHIAFEASVAEKGIDQYLGRIAKTIKKQFYAHMQHVPEEGQSQKYKAALEAVAKFKEYHADKTITVGDIKVTPYYVSHSAADAYMFVVECDGKTILHTGDFRDHGYLGHFLVGTLKKFVAGRDIDVLITEGTTLSRADERMMPEEELQQKAYELMSDYKYAFVINMPSYSAPRPTRTGSPHSIRLPPATRAGCSSRTDISANCWTHSHAVSAEKCLYIISRIHVNMTRLFSNQCLSLDSLCSSGPPTSSRDTWKN